MTSPAFSSLFSLATAQLFANLAPFTVIIYFALTIMGYQKLKHILDNRTWDHLFLAFGTSALLMLLTYFFNDIVFSFCFALRYGYSATNNGITGFASGVIDFGWAVVVLWLVLPLFKQKVIGVNWRVLLGFVLNGILVFCWMFLTPSYLSVDYRAAINHGVGVDSWVWSFLGNYLLGKPIIVFTYLSWWHGFKPKVATVLLNLPLWRKAT